LGCFTASFVQNLLRFCICIFSSNGCLAGIFQPFGYSSLALFEHPGNWPVGVTLHKHDQNYQRANLNDQVA
jgi:hypothetical protein